MMGSGNRWRWCGGVAAILLFALLLLIRLGLLDRALPRAGNEAAPVEAGIPEGEIWMNILQGERKIGYAARTVAATDQGFRVSENAFVTIHFLGAVQPLTMRTMASLRADRTLADFRFDLTSGLFCFRIRGEVTGKKLILWTGDGDKEKRSMVELGEMPHLWSGLVDSFGRMALRQGEERIVMMFDPLSFGLNEARITLLGDESLTVLGESRRARKLAVDFRGIKQFVWIDGEGTVLREEGILGMVLERVSRETALIGIDAAAVVDFTEIAAVPSSRPIDDPPGLKTLKIRLEGLPASTPLLHGGRQVYRDSLLTIRRESLLGDPDISRDGPGEPEDYLKPMPFVESDHPKIVQAVREIVIPGDPPEARAQKILSWIYGRLAKRPVLSVPDALETLEKGEGDCNEHAVLLAAMARAAGIPAEIEAGVVYQRGRFYYHAWNILHLGAERGWVTADAALGQLPADVTHIRFVRGAADRQLDLLAFIGKVKIEVVEMKR